MWQKTSVEPYFGLRIDVPQAGEVFGRYGPVPTPGLMEPYGYSKAKCVFDRRTLLKAWAWACMDVGANPVVPPSGEGVFCDDGDGKLTTDATIMGACQNPLVKISY